MLNRTSRIAARLTRNSPVIRHYATQPQSPLYTGSADSRLVLKRNQYNPSKVLIGRIDKSSPPPHLFTLADLSPSQISTLLKDAIVHKHVFKNLSPLKIRKTLTGRTVALIFDKRSTRTRVASETAANALGGAALFMGRQDVQLGVNESMRDTAQVVGSMVDGIVARVNSQADIEVPTFPPRCRCITELLVDPREILWSPRHQRPIRTLPSHPDPRRPHGASGSLLTRARSGI